MLAAAALTTPTFLIVWAIDTVVAVLIFLHATKRGSRHATAWGVSVFFALGLALPIYFLHGRLHRPSGRRY
jgi:hypothetical protein